ncbi:tail assembly structural protein [Synechococcus virus S-ESS1]|uniref:Tail assembly structural protein n=1 Tax=Synechococcus virus S-ESS1 TaxID=1964565 RepID=A0A1V0DX21_9CAUD|nr:tail protein [Synechococcus virus S-ESS1]ARB05708.1 tail assembly structural protein [Synechococcus virus S-ESS1]
MNGGVISETRNYYGIRNPILAKIVADRDVLAAGYPVFVCQAKVDRTFWRVRPGDVVTLSWPEEGLVNAVMRVMGVDYGSPQDRTITLDLSEDIFAMEQTAYANSQQGLLETDRVEAPPSTER